MPENEYISVTQFAQKFGKDVGNVRKLIKDGRIPAIKIGNQWAIPADAEPRFLFDRLEPWRFPRLCR